MRKRYIREIHTYIREIQERKRETCIMKNKYAQEKEIQKEKHIKKNIYTRKETHIDNKENTTHDRNTQ